MFVLELNHVVTSMNVILDEIEVMHRNHNIYGIIIDESTKTVDDFTHLVNMICRDTYIHSLYVVTRISISHSFIVGYVARLQGTHRLGPEE